MAKIATQGVILILAVLAYHLFFRKKAARNLPPGPKPLPILGNIRDLPPKGVPEYQHWLKHRESYGPISSVTVLGQLIVILHDRQLAYELLEKGAKKTAARPRMEFAHNLCGFNNWIASMPFDENCKEQRRIMHQLLGSKASVARFHGVIEVEAKKILLRIWREPERLLHLFTEVTNATILKMLYGYSVDQEKEDPLVCLMERVMVHFSQAFAAAAWAVDIIPALKHLPSGLPGMGFQETARRCKLMTDAVSDIPYSYTRRQMEAPDHQLSYVTRLLQGRMHGDGGGTEEGPDRMEKVIKYSASALWAGASETTVASIRSFALAMTLFPDVQRKAQEEIDRVTGATRLPSLEDRDELPYIEAVTKEALRWQPVAPMGMIHSLDEDVVCGGYDIPKGAQILPATWWHTHDPQVYREPDAFDPERYLARSEPDPRALVFGYGRRLCPGQYFADANLFVIIAQLLAVFRMSKGVDEDGREIEARIEYTAGIVSHPKEFPYRIEPRNAGAVDLLRALEAEVLCEESDARHVEEEIKNVYREAGKSNYNRF